MNSKLYLGLYLSVCVCYASTDKSNKLCLFWGQVERNIEAGFLTIQDS